MKKTDICICENKYADQLRGVTAKLISAFVFAIRKVQFLFYLNLKFQASSHLLWLYSPFVSDLVGNPEDRFSHNEAHMDKTAVLNDIDQHGSWSMMYCNESYMYPSRYLCPKYEGILTRGYQDMNS